MNEACNTCNRCNRCGQHNCVTKVPIFSVLDIEEQDKVHELIIHKKYQKGELILMEGDKQEGLMILHSGKVKVLRYSTDGREQILYILSQGDFFGERSLYGSRKSACYVEALEDTELCIIRNNAFNSFLKMHPETAVKMIDEMGRRLERLEDALQNIGVKSVESRVTSVLIEFAEQFGRQEKEGVLLELPLSREGIANYIGIARETVSRKLGLLQDEGLIVAIGNKKLLIPDIHKLEQSM